ncbi:hypothetical protein B0T17DRAFT_653061 [Bombardia bombarda]|uniref:Peptidase M20 domain-containing protein 2 n=1 Tax=Bombardia bombarda TaxID=252184 RepID=A0AA39X953_9PEZI|nr:hypothetical protein B0T17DRAFT_653061 [Bombardia bombarda]
MASEFVIEDGFVVVNKPPPNPSAEILPHLLLADISDTVDKLSASLWPVNRTIHDHPELGFKEVIAHDTLTAFMSTQPGWRVTRSAYGLETAWVAVLDSGKAGPAVSFNVEMDALPGIGHACGHNLIAIASVAAGLAAGQVMLRRQCRGKIVMFGTPAEEGGGGKIKLLQRGAYQSHRVDISLLSHPGIIPSSALVHTTAYTRFQAEYFGREAHAAAAPWEGINALDALITAYNALSVLRQQTMPSDIIQGHITSGGSAPNIIHAYAAGVFVIRAETNGRLQELRKKVDACFTAGATATGATLKVTEMNAYADHVPNRVLGRRIPEDQDVDEIRGASMASTDQGDISHAMPSLMPGFKIKPGPGPGGSGPHNPGFADSAGTRQSFDKGLEVAKALAGTALDVLMEERTTRRDQEGVET